MEILCEESEGCNDLRQYFRNLEDTGYRLRWQPAWPWPASEFSEVSVV
jgi:hypothetical protein